MHVGVGCEKGREEIQAGGDGVESRGKDCLCDPDDEYDVDEDIYKWSPVDDESNVCAEEVLVLRTGL